MSQWLQSSFIYSLWQMSINVNWVDLVALITSNSLMALLCPGFGKFTASHEGPQDVHFCLILRSKDRVSVCD